MLAMAYYVYLLASKKHGTLYLGVTRDLVRRVYEHRTKAVESFTSRYGVDKLVWFEIYDDAATAIAREKELKKWRRDWKKNRIPGGSIFIPALQCRMKGRVRNKPRHSGARALRKIDYVNFVAERASPESITTIVSMDSGPAPRGRVPE
jgi:putative endonuclease